MADNTRAQGVLFTGASKKAVVARFDQEHASSDGGALLLKELDEGLGLSHALAACLRDDRQQSKIKHEYEELFRQRMFGIACGYADCNDAARLAHDPVHKLLAGRDPVEGLALASQPTLSRFENAIGERELVRMSHALTDTVISQHQRRLRQVRRITIDLDPTVDRTHGNQQLSFFRSHYDSWCYLPVAAFLTFDDEPEQYLFACVLRPGNASDKAGALAILKRLLPKLRGAFPGAKVRVRLDGGFTGPELYRFFDAHELEYVVGMAGNSVLKALAEPYMELVRKNPETRQYGETQYRARSWGKERRAVIKAEIVTQPGRKPKENPRFVITNIAGSPEQLYALYCQRGDVENRIKELKDGLQIDRTSCTSFIANQLRVLMTAAAYVLMQTLRLHARGTQFVRAQVDTLRVHLLKFGAWVETSVRRMVFHFPAGQPYAADWQRIAQSIGAIPT